MKKTMLVKVGLIILIISCIASLTGCPASSSTSSSASISKEPNAIVSAESKDAIYVPGQTTSSSASASK